jgi:hypothetical protein
MINEKEKSKISCFKQTSYSIYLFDANNKKNYNKINTFSFKIVRKRPEERERDVIFESQHNKNEIFFGTKKNPKTIEMHDFSCKC